MTEAELCGGYWDGKRLTRSDDSFADVISVAVPPVIDLSQPPADPTKGVAYETVVYRRTGRRDDGTVIYRLR